MLEPTFKILQIKFDSNIVEKIIKEEKGVSLTLLYQLKMVCTFQIGNERIQRIKMNNK
jgi:hypothetical protein